MMKLISCIALSAALAVMACGSNPSSSNGTLTTVQGFEINRTASKGDSVFFSWSAAGSSQNVDGYNIYSSGTDSGNWNLIGSTDATVWTYTASAAAEYTVKAYRGEELSPEYSTVDTTRTIFTSFTANPNFYIWLDTDNNGFFVTPDGTGGASGPASNSEFLQDFYVDKIDNTFFLYSGNFNPSEYPSGHTTSLCPVTTTGSLAPAPGSGLWVDSIEVTGSISFFLKMEEGYFSKILIDEVSADSIRVSSLEYQSICNLRLFNGI